MDSGNGQSAGGAEGQMNGVNFSTVGFGGSTSAADEGNAPVSIMPQQIKTKLPNFTISLHIFISFPGFIFFKPCLNINQVLHG
jgi:hypothetical protein